MEILTRALDLTFTQGSATLHDMNSLSQTGSGMHAASSGRGRPGLVEKRFLISTCCRNPWILAGICTLLIGVFVIPWHISNPTPVLGESFALGYYNRVAILSVCIAMALVLLGLLRIPNSGTALDWFEPAADPLPTVNTARAEYIVLGVFSVIATLGILTWNYILVNPYWGEAGYFLSRIDYVCLGFQPYRDFLFNYGPLLLYLPIWVDRLSAGLLGIENAYALVIALCFVGGFSALFVFQRTLRIPNQARAWVLGLSLLTWCTLSMGLQGVPLRFTIIPCTLVLIHKRIPRLADQHGGLVGIVLITLLGTLFCFAISAEMGVGAELALLAYAIVLCMGKRWIVGLGVILGVVGNILLTLWLFGDYLQSMQGFGAGAFNFPIYPSLHNLLFLGAYLYVCPMLAVGILRNPSHPAAPLAAALAMAAVVMLPAALGRSDPGHIQSNGAIALTMLFPALVNAHKRVQLAWGTLYAIVFVGLFQLSYWNHYTGIYRIAWADHVAAVKDPAILEAARANWEQEKRAHANGRKLNWHKPVPYSDAAHRLVRIARIAAPMPIGIELERLLTLQEGFRPLYRPTRGNDMFSMKEVQENLNECMAYDYILLPTVASKYAHGKIDLPTFDREVHEKLSRLLIFPVREHARHTPFVPEFEFSRLLFARCDTVIEGAELIILKPQPASH